jgi:hypothetical protein
MADPSETTQVSRAPAETDERELLSAVRALSAQVGELQAEITELRSQAQSLPSGELEHPGWDVPSATLRDGGAWVRSLDAPSSRRLSVPWLAVEIAFLVAVAVLAVVADLGVLVIVGLMAAAWAVVALGEWAGARAARQRHALTYGAYTPVPTALPEDPSWLEPPSERTALDAMDESQRTVTRLPPPTD